MLTEQQILEFATGFRATHETAFCTGVQFGARWANNQNAAEIQDLSAQNKEIKNSLFRIQAQYEQAAKEAVVNAAEIARLKAEKAELLDLFGEVMAKSPTGGQYPFWVDVRNRIGQTLKKHGRK